MAIARERGRVRLVGVARRSRSALLVSTALQAVVVIVLAVPAAAQPAPNARPSGGVVVGGNATINQTLNNTTIDQTSQRAALNWRSFDVGSQQSVTFQQPNANSIALNTVTGPNPSQIAGRIDANGQVVLVNQSGVTFYKGSQVNTAGLMVSAASTDPKAFMGTGKVAFNQAGNPNARIINNGNITISGAGLASLVAPGVANAGVINAQLGHVVLASAKTETLDLYGDKLVTVNVTGAVTRAPDGGEALVTNTGVIEANGGTVRLTARAVDGVVTNLVTAGGNIQARTVGSHQGRISIEGVGGSITITGSLDATGTTGGRIGLRASDAVTVRSGAVVNASGAAGGGTIAIGTTLNQGAGKQAAGGPAVTHARMAKTVVIQRGATIAANATAQGNGGRVAVLSSDSTTMDGAITATGGPAGGNGGYVEVSGGALSLTGAVDVTAPNGLLGNILLDPTNLTVVASGGDLDGGISGTGTLLAGVADSTNDTVSASKLSGNILLQATKNLTVNAALGPTGSLTLEAGGTLTVNDPVAATGDVILATGGAGPAGAPAAQPSPLLSLLSSVSSGGGSVSLLAGVGGTLNIGASGLVNVTTGGKRATLQADTLTVAAGGQVSVVGGTIEIAPASAIELDLGGTNGLALSQPVLSAMSAGTLRLGGATINGSLIQTASSIAVDGSIDLAAVTAHLDLQSTGAVTQAAPLTGVQSLTGDTGGVTLTGAGNTIGSVGAYTVASGGFSLTTSGGLAIDGAVSAPAAVLRSTGGGITLGTNGEVAVSASDAASFVADTFSNAGIVTGGTFEYAPNTPGILTLGAGGGLVSLAGIETSNVRLGAANGTTTATGITLAGNFDLADANGSPRPLDLEANGNVSDAGTSNLTSVSTLTGTGTGGSVSFTSGSSGIGAIGGFTVTERPRQRHASPSSSRRHAERPRLADRCRRSLWRRATWRFRRDFHGRRRGGLGGAVRQSRNAAAARSPAAPSAAPVRSPPARFRAPPSPRWR